jgi:NAD-dependent dihydropyrimidine dehydrogenase PreA subunit
VTFVITTTCIDEQDQSCVEVCPVDCIHFEEGIDTMLFIDPIECIDCGACEPVCPVDAIYTDDTVPAAETRFTEINALWFQDRDAARALVSGGVAPAPAAAPAADATPAAETDAADAAPAEPTEKAAPAEAEAPEPAAVASTQTQVAAIDGHEHTGVTTPDYKQPSPVGIVAMVVLAASFFFMWIGPDPRWGDFLGLRGPSQVGVGVAIIPALISLLLLLRSQWSDLARFAAKGPRRTAAWRDVNSDWRRSEETRRHELARAVNAIAATRFQFPSDRFPNYKTHVNVPEPSMALEFGGAGIDQAFPDIIVTEQPGNYPVMVAQVETEETLTRDQVEHVWKRLEMSDAPIDIYVPAGLAHRAKDYARAAGLKHVRFRTFRHNPDGVTVREV